MITMSNGGHSVPTYMHPDMFALRATTSADAFVAQIGFRIESISIRC